MEGRKEAEESFFGPYTSPDYGMLLNDLAHNMYFVFSEQFAHRAQSVSLALCTFVRLALYA